MFGQDFSCPDLLTRSLFSLTYNILLTGLSPSMARFSNLFCYIISYIDSGYFHFARRYFGNLFWFLLLQVLRCFTSLSSPPIMDTLYLYRVGCPIRISPYQCSLTAPRGFSQSSTSFFASPSLGIHHLPWVSSLFTTLLNVASFVVFTLLLTSYCYISQTYSHKSN